MMKTKSKAKWKESNSRNEGKLWIDGRISTRKGKESFWYTDGKPFIYGMKAKGRWIDI